MGLVVSGVQALRRAFVRLQDLGFLQYCSFGLQHLGIAGVAVDFHGSHLPSKFPNHERYV